MNIIQSVIKSKQKEKKINKTLASMLVVSKNLSVSKVISEIKIAFPEKDLKNSVTCITLGDTMKSNTNYTQPLIHVKQNSKKLNKTLASMLVGSILSLPENHLNILDLAYGTSEFFNKAVISPSRAYFADKIYICTKTVTRGTNRLEAEGLIKKTNEKVSNGKECRNKFSELDMGHFKRILHFIKKHNRKKYALLVIAFAALRVINISSVPEINPNINIKKISITTKSNSKLISDENSTKVINNLLSFKNNEIEEEIPTRTTPVLPSDMVMDWVPATKFSLKRELRMKEECVYTQEYAFEIYEAYQSEDYKKWIKYIQWKAKDEKEKEIERLLRIKEEKEFKLVATASTEAARGWLKLDISPEKLKGAVSELLSKRHL